MSPRSKSPSRKLRQANLRWMNSSSPTRRRQWSSSLTSGRCRCRLALRKFCARSANCRTFCFDSKIRGGRFPLRALEPFAHVVNEGKTVEAHIVEIDDDEAGLRAYFATDLALRGTLTVGYGSEVTAEIPLDRLKLKPQRLDEKENRCEIPSRHAARSRSVPAPRLGLQPPWALTRCLIPADGFYEWTKSLADGGKDPWHIFLPGPAPFSFAGLWTHNDKLGITSCTIMTMPAAEPMRQPHDRQPVILDPAVYDAWLDPATPRVEGVARSQS